MLGERLDETIAMTDLFKKQKILIFILNYLPGYKSGGVLRTIVNTVVWLSNDYEFWIVTRDRDLGSDQPYSEININDWQYVEGAMVRYLPPESITTRNLVKLISNTPHDLIHLNSFFDPVFTLRILLARKIGWSPNTPLLLSPRGEFGEGSLKLKYAKKIVFIKISKLIGLFDEVVWHATSKYELQDIIGVLNFNIDAVRMALDLPSKVIPDMASNRSLSDRALRVVFLSRISREKNLDFALQIFKQVSANVVFDIYGPDEDLMYWKECQELIEKLPKNIAVSYRGPVSPNRVAEIFSGYDLFFFPSKGENYGHVIAESISVGTKILISKNTPWLNLESDELGWDVDLKDEGVFVNIIEKLAGESLDDRIQKRVIVKKGALKRLFDPKIVNDNRELFRISL
jgi:glycosyltransferase involved in cell wall biosynthesis